MKISTKVADGEERYGALSQTTQFRMPDGGIGQMVMEHESSNGATPMDPPKVKPRLPSLDLEEPVEPVYPDSEWLTPGPSSLADHPLLRGLLLELPPRGTVPPPGWLDRWFEATRSILELLYVKGR